MIRILWLCNTVINGFEKAYNFPECCVGGWMNSMLDCITNQSDYEIGLCFPIKDMERVKDGIINGINCYSLYIGKGEIEEGELISRAQRILTDFRPDVVHIWGTEFEHSYIMCCACKINGIRFVVDIQGIASANAEACTKGIPYDDICYKPENSESIMEYTDKRKMNAIKERKCLRETRIVIGRTMWDYLYTKHININITYYHVDRLLRSEFYKEKRTWCYEKCSKNTIFISQSGRPYKGLHFFIMAFIHVVKIHPMITVKISGDSRWLYEKKNGYGAYIEKLLGRYNIKRNFVFLGNLTAQEMIEQYLQANMYILPSVVENNSNSLCEAQYLGTPVVAAFVGGIGDIVKHGETGILYSYDDCITLASIILEYISDKGKLKGLSRKERTYAAKRHNIDKIIDDMKHVYKSIAELNSEVEI